MSDEQPTTPQFTTPIADRVSNDAIRLAMLSWKELRPDRPYAVVLAIEPEIMRRHEEVVQHYIDCGFDCFKAVRRIFDNRIDFGELPDDSQTFHKRLSEVLRKLHRGLQR